MRILTFQDVCRRKFERRRSIPGLQSHAGGYAVHLGPISPGCRPCFLHDPASMFIPVGRSCNRRCVYCTTRFDGADSGPAFMRRVKARYRAALPRLSRGAPRPKIAFTGGGEPLLYLDEVASYLRSFLGPRRPRGPRPWVYLYTNGLHATADRLRRLADLGLDEIRFHLGASDFAPAVRRRLRVAAGIVPVVTVETPAWPPHRRRLLDLLPFFADAGVRHLNIGEVQVNAVNLARIAARLLGAEVYHVHLLHLYDGGLVYDVMERVAERGYPYSVLDCSGFVKQIQRGPAADVWPPDVDGLCAEYPERRDGAGRGPRALAGGGAPCG